MVMVNAEGEDLNDYAKQFSVVEYGKSNPPMYYENYGPTKFIGGYYKIITYLSLDDYTKKYETLGERIGNLSITCRELTHNLLCAKYQNVLAQLYNEVVEEREKLYMSLGRGTENDTNITEEDGEERHKLSKRGLVNFVGKGMNYLFGVCDDECTTNTNDAIDRTEKNGKNVMHILKQQTTVVKTAMKQITATLNETQLFYKEIKDHEETFIKDMGLIGNETQKILTILGSNALQNLYTLLTNQFAYETATLNQIVTAARAGVIHSSLLTVDDMTKLIKDIKTRTDRKNLELPMGTKSVEIYELLKVVKMSVFYGKNRIVFITKIPLVTTEEHTMYNLIPIPIRHKSGGAIVEILEIEAPYVVISKDRREYTPMGEDQLNKCIETKIIRICPAHLPIQHVNDMSPCEIDLLNEPIKKGRDNTNCKIRTATMTRGIYHKLRYTNEWIYSVQLDTLMITCKNIEQPIIKRAYGIGIIKIIDTSCQISTTYAILTPDEDIQAHTHINFIPKTDMSEIYDNIPNNTLILGLKHLKEQKGVKFTELSKVSKSLDEIQYMIDAEEYRQNNEEKTKHHSYMLYVSLALGIISLILMLIIYIIVKCHNNVIMGTHSNFYPGDYRMTQQLPLVRSPSPR